VDEAIEAFQYLFLPLHFVGMSKCTYCMTVLKREKNSKILPDFFIKKTQPAMLLYLKNASSSLKG
jgi:hypothetical protein